MEWQQYEDEGHEVLGEQLAGRQDRYVTVRRWVVCHRPAHWLIEEPQQAQLVVVGSRGRGGYADMLLGYRDLDSGVPAIGPKGPMANAGNAITLFSAGVNGDPLRIQKEHG